MHACRAKDLEPVPYQTSRQAPSLCGWYLCCQSKADLAVIRANQTSTSHYPAGLLDSLPLKHLCCSSGMGHHHHAAGLCMQWRMS